MLVSTCPFPHTASYFLKVTGDGNSSSTVEYIDLPHTHLFQLCHVLASMFKTDDTHCMRFRESSTIQPNQLMHQRHKEIPYLGFPLTRWMDRASDKRAIPGSLSACTKQGVNVSRLSFKKKSPLTTIKITKHTVSASVHA